MTRWSTKDPDSAPGSPYDSEKPDTAGRSFLQLGAVQSATSIGRSFRREQFVEADASGIAIGQPGKAPLIPWSDVASIHTNLSYPRHSQDAAISLVLHDGTSVDLPDALYPDAATDFPSHRHIERARQISRELTELLTVANGPS